MAAKSFHAKALSELMNLPPLSHIHWPFSLLPLSPSSYDFIIILYPSFLFSFTPSKHHRFIVICVPFVSQDACRLPDLFVLNVV